MHVSRRAAHDPNSQVQKPGNLHLKYNKLHSQAQKHGKLHLKQADDTAA